MWAAALGRGMELVLEERDAAGYGDVGRPRSSSAERRRLELGGKVVAATRGQRGGGRGSWAWSDDATSLKILQRAFKLFDKDGDGSISPSELKSVLSNLGEDIQDDMVQAMIDLGDTNNCGQVSYSDFLKIMTGKPLPPKSDVSHKSQTDLRKMFTEIDIDGTPPARHSPPTYARAPAWRLADLRPSCWEHRLRVLGPGRGENSVRQAGWWSQESPS